MITSKTSPFCALVLGVLFFSLAITSGPGCGPSSKGVGSNQDGSQSGDGAGMDSGTDPFTDDDGDGYTEMQGDCDDGNPNIHPFAEEICDDEVDNDCNGYVDGSEPDQDADGWGPCRGDCNDTDPEVNPGHDEVAGNGIDDNCDGITDADFDGDGWTEADGDCDDGDPLVNPGADENCFDGVDNNCNGFTDGDEPDADNDGFGPCQGDCNDSDPNINPNQPEIDGDGIDNNCDFLVDEDIDGDGWTVANGDCDDNNPVVNPAAWEDCSDGIDNNCDGQTDTGCMDPCTMAAAVSTYLGCEFYAVDLPQFNLNKDYAILVSNPSTTQTANITITTVSSTVATFTVPPAGLQYYSVTGSAQRTQNISTTGVHNKAYRVNSDLPVAVYQFNSLTTLNAASTDASLLFASHSLARRYYVMDYTARTTTDSFVAVVGTQPNTSVQLFPSVSVSGPTSATLNAYDVLVVFASSSNTSLTGTRVEADKPVGVFGGNRCTNVPWGLSYCDHVEQQIFPRQAIGDHYVVAKSQPRPSCDPPDRLRVLADTDNTVVTFNPAVAGPWNLNAGEWQEIELSQSVEITATNPILVGQFLRSSGGSQCNDEGDPAFILQVPIAQFRVDYVFLTPDTYDIDYVDIIAPIGATVQLDGAPVVLSSTTIGGSNYSVTSTTLTPGVHTVLSSQPVGVMVYGIGGPQLLYGNQNQNVSYGYPAGLDLEAINPVE